jgi:hypothetical protein
MENENDLMSEFRKNRNFSQPIIWEWDLNDDCTARWAGLMLRAEWMDKNIGGGASMI